MSLPNQQGQKISEAASRTATHHAPTSVHCSNLPPDQSSPFYVNSISRVNKGNSPHFHTNFQRKVVEQAWSCSWWACHTTAAKTVVTSRQERLVLQRSRMIIPKRQAPLAGRYLAVGDEKGLSSLKIARVSRRCILHGGGTSEA